jgi:hypothetical protein
VKTAVIVGDLQDGDWDVWPGDFSIVEKRVYCLIYQDRRVLAGVWLQALCEQ